MPYVAKIFASVLILAAAQVRAAAVEDTSVERAIDRGRTMYLYDRAAWVTSDDAMMRVPKDRAPEIGGWIVTASARGLHVDYFGKEAAADQVIYSANVADQAVTNATCVPGFGRTCSQGASIGDGPRIARCVGRSPAASGLATLRTGAV